jgi:hypothetical protein
VSDNSSRTSSAPDTPAATFLIGAGLYFAGKTNDFIIQSIWGQWGPPACAVVAPMLLY